MVEKNNFSIYEKAIELAKKSSSIAFLDVFISEESKTLEIQLWLDSSNDIPPIPRAVFAPIPQ